MNRFATFYREQKTKNAAGDIEIDFQAFITRFPCGFRPERGTERTDEGHRKATGGGVLRVRSFTLTRGITTADTLVLHDGADDVTYNIRAIDNYDRHHKFLSMEIERGEAQR